MAGNSILAAAKKNKNDEFYTRKIDIEDELRYYERHFRGKTVYCNCDDPEKSEFWKFFVRNFRAWGLKKLIATHYEPDSNNYSYMISAEGDIDPLTYKPVRVPIQSNGDFRSAACVELLKEADIVVSNPPFSLFRDYVAQLIEFGKKFLIVSNKNAVVYKEIFPLIRNNDMWIGHRNMNLDFWLRVPDSDPCEKTMDGDRVRHIMACWLTNMDITKRHEKLDMRGSKYYGNESDYPRYDNYDAIEVGKVCDIPGDYYGVMGVPITFLDKYCPEQFEILWTASGHTPTTCPPDTAAVLGYKDIVSDSGTKGYAIVGGKQMYHRLMIRRK